METISIEILNKFKEIDESYVDKFLNKEIQKNNKKIVVLDDDPTGVQTVHDVSVYTDWSKESIKSGFKEENKLFYILTNSRGFTTEQTTKVHTEIAKDKTFGYTSSNMCEYIEEKTNGEYKKENVTCISLDDIRSLNFDKIEKQLLQVNDFNKIIVNAIDYCDIKVFCVALYRAMAKGKTYMFRTAAAIVKVIGGITDQPLLTKEKMIIKENKNGGIVVIGYIPRKRW